MLRAGVCTLSASPRGAATATERWPEHSTHPPPTHTPPPACPLQDAKRKELDLRAPVEKQRAKRFNIDEELARLKAATVDAAYENKPIPRTKEWEGGH